MIKVEKPKPKLTAKDNIMLKHDFSKNIYVCTRCEKTTYEIEACKLNCISQVRVDGNAAIRKIVIG